MLEVRKIRYVESWMTQLLNMVTARGNSNEHCWIENGAGKIYVRSYCYPGNIGASSKFDAIDIVNIVINPACRGQGLFIEFLTRVEKLCDSRRYELRLCQIEGTHIVNWINERGGWQKVLSITEDAQISPIYSRLGTSPGKKIRYVRGENNNFQPNIGY